MPPAIETRAPATAGKLIRELLAVSPNPYPDSAAIERGRALKSLYYYADRDRALGNDLAALVRSSHWARLALVTWTKDEQASSARTKPFPPLECYYQLSQWADARKPSGRWANPLLAIDKSRQVMLSWWSVARLAWLAEWSQYGSFPIISKKEKDALKMLKRVRVMGRMHPAWYVRAAGLEDVKYLAGIVEYPNEATIDALPQEGEQVRSTVPVAWLGDEFAFQSEAEPNFNALTAYGDKCQGMMVTTPAPGFFEELIHDRTNGPGGRGEILFRGLGGSPVPHLCDEPGLTIWRNERNKLSCARLFFWADPGKRSTEHWETITHAKPMHQVKQEFLCDYTSRGGQPVWPMADADCHMMLVQPQLRKMGDGKWYLWIPGDYFDKAGRQPVWREVTLYRAIDHGFRRHGALWVAQDCDRDLFVYRARLKEGWGQTGNMQEIAEWSGVEDYKGDWCDAIGHDRIEEGGGQALDQYQRFVLPDGSTPFRRVCRPIKGAGSRKSGVDAIASLLLSTLAAESPEHPHFVAEKYDQRHIESMADCARIYIAPEAKPLFDEIVAARFDERPDPTLDKPETTLDAPDELTDCLRYVIAGLGARALERRRDGENGFKAVRAG